MENEQTNGNMLFIQDRKLGHVTLPKLNAAVSPASLFCSAEIFAFFPCAPLRLKCKRTQIFVQLEY